MVASPSDGWAQLGAELNRQAAPGSVVSRSATELLETVHQMVEIIRREQLMPILVFDDTDRWLAGSAYAEPTALVEGFFGRVLPDLAELRCALVVAVHRRYLKDAPGRTAIRRVLDTPIEVPALVSAAGIAGVLESRIHAHAQRSGAGIDDVFEGDAVERLYGHYRQGLRGEVRGVVGAAHIALTEACDDGIDVIGPQRIDDAIDVWNPS